MIITLSIRYKCVPIAAASIAQQTCVLPIAPLFVYSSFLLSSSFLFIPPLFVYSSFLLSSSFLFIPPVFVYSSFHLYFLPVSFRGGGCSLLLPHLQSIKFSKARSPPRRSEWECPGKKAANELPSLARLQRTQDRTQCTIGHKPDAAYSVSMRSPCQTCP